MHNRDWNDGWGSGYWWWMAIMMIVFWGGLIWVAVTLIRRGDHTHQPHTPGAAPITPPKQTPQETLADRLARGEIEPDDYRQRLDALQHRQNE
jgi:putative membrane protein